MGLLQVCDFKRNQYLSKMLPGNSKKVIILGCLCLEWRDCPTCSSSVWTHEGDEVTHVLWCWYKAQKQGNLKQIHKLKIQHKNDNYVINRCENLSLEMMLIPLTYWRREKLLENWLKRQDTSTLPNSSTVTKPVRKEKAPPHHPKVHRPTQRVGTEQVTYFPPASNKASFLFVCDSTKVP